MSAFIAQRRSIVVLALALLCLFVGCGTDAQPEQSNAPARKANAAAATSGAAAVSATNIRKSVFNAEKVFPDPFFPNRRQPILSAAPTTNEPPADMGNLLTAGFQGVIGTPDRRLAIIYNTILEPNKNAVITARVGGQEHKIAVRCIEVQRNGVVVQVEGQPLPITVTRGQENKL